MEQLKSSNYLLLTTLRKDGREVSTPMWASFDSATSRFCMQTYAGSAKVKRIRNNPSVFLTPCDSRGNVQAGAIRAKAKSLVVEPTSAEGQLADRLLAKRYGLARRAIGFLLWMTRRSQKVYLILTVDAEAGQS